MSKSVLDASAVLALLNGEEGQDQVWPLVNEAVISAVNASEVQAKLVKVGLARESAWDAILGCVREVIPFDARQAELSGTLFSSTSSAGLSLGDRACLALGSVLELPVYTADQAWKNLEIGVEIRVIGESTALLQVAH